MPLLLGSKMLNIRHVLELLNICPIYDPNVGKYSNTMDPMGMIKMVHHFLIRQHGPGAGRWRRNLPGSGSCDVARQGNGVASGKLTQPIGTSTHL